MTMPRDPNLVWHYTTGGKLKAIAESGVLLPTSVGVNPPERPILWFSAQQWWEPTACKMIREGDGFRRLTMEETRTMGRPYAGLARFGVDRSALIAWALLPQLARMPAAIVQQLIRSAEGQGAKPDDWYGTFEPIPLTDVLAIDVIDEHGREWVRVQSYGRPEGEPVH